MCLIYRCLADSEKNTGLSLNLQMGGTFPFHVTISSSPLILQVPLFWAFPKFLSSSWPSHQVRETEAAT